jgi:hypothetical protein
MARPIRWCRWPAAPIRRKAIPGARLHVIEGMGHDLPPQLIERLLALLDHHLRGNLMPELAAAVRASCRQRHAH